MIVDLVRKKLIRGEESFSIELPEPLRRAMVTGQWDATGMLIEGLDAARAVASRLPYLNRFSAA